MARISTPLAFAVACLGIAVFSGMDAVIKGLAIEIGAYNAMLWRSLAGVILSGGLFVAGRRPWPDRATLILHFKRSAAAAFSVLLFFWGLVRVPMAEGVALTFLSPLIAILLAAVMLGERIRRNAMLACGLAFVGVAVIVVSKSGQGTGDPALAGRLAILLASLFYAYNLVQLRASALQSGPIEITFFTNLVFLGLYALGAPFAAVWPAAEHWPALFGAAALAIVSSLLLAWAYAHAETQKLVPVEYTAFVWSALLGWLVFGERVVPATVIGAVLIIGGAAIGARRQAGGPVTEAAL
nr:DMT family transporter [Sphingomonas bacterium]